jgi:outer membrane protein OmpA-like peptidoglycan-associated protein
MRYGIRLTVVAAALSIFGGGCIATEEWTQDLFAKRQVEVDERVGQVETEVHEQGERIDRVEIKVAQLDTGLTETRDLVRGTLAQRGGAVAARTTTPAVPGRRTLVGVVHVPFAFDRADLDASAEAALASIVKELRDHPQMTIDLEGTTDPVGRLEYNVRLSQRRVEAVKHWLVSKGVDRTRIINSTGRGPLADASVKNNLKRRVMVKLMNSAE